MPPRPKDAGQAASQAAEDEWIDDGELVDAEPPTATVTDSTRDPAIDVLFEPPGGEFDEIAVEFESPAPASPAAAAAAVTGQRRESAPPPSSFNAPGKRFSLEPTANDVDPDALTPPQPQLRRRHWAAIAGGITLTIGILALSATVNGHGSLLVTAGQSAATTPGAVRLLVDGVLRCDELPCRVDELPPGRHLLRAESEQRTELAKVEVEIRADSETPVPLLLVHGVPEQARTSPPPPAVRAEEGAEGSPGLEHERVPATATERIASRQPRQARIAPAVPQPGARASGQAAEQAPSAASNVKPPTAGDGNGSLVVTSEPSGMVVVDGQRRGWTPKTITLPAGPHTVSVQHPERGSQSADVTIRAKSSTMLRIDL